MKPLFYTTKNIDDISIYFEIYAKNALAEEFANVFSDGKFTQKQDNVLVLLHGNGEDGSIFNSIVEQLSEICYCIVPDTRGHGKTTAGTMDFTVDLLAEDLSKLCDELNLGNFRLLGFSDGGNTAITYAVRHPERLSALIAAGANINPSGLSTSFLLTNRIKLAVAKASKDKNEKSNLRYQLLSLMINHPHINPRLLRNIPCPALIMCAEKDLIKKSHTELIASSIKNSKLITVPDSTHDIFNTNHNFTTAAIKEFLLTVE